MRDDPKTNLQKRSCPAWDNLIGTLIPTVHEAVATQRSTAFFLSTKGLRGIAACDRPFLLVAQAEGGCGTFLSSG